MSDSVIFKRPKSRPVQRLRQASPELAEGNGGEREGSPSTVVTRLKKRDKSKSKLSFGHDEVTVRDHTKDFISLAVTRRSDEYQGPHPESRLVREEDELGEGDDEFAEYTSALERIALGKKSKKVEAEKRRDTLKKMIKDVEEDDDESMEWEQAQIRRGGHFRDSSADRKPEKQIYKAAPIPPETAIPTLKAAIARLTQSFQELTVSHAQNVSSLNSLADERAQLDARETEMREMIGKAEEKRSWFAAFREWVESVATFLDEKFPQLEKLEDEHVSLLKERSDMITSRRSTDDEDDLCVIFGPLPVLPERAERDELGRTRPTANPVIAARERRSARSLRHVRRTSKTDAEEGYSTDASLSPSDATDFNTAMQKLLADKKAILSDVRAVEFKDPSRGLAKWFGEWRSRFGDTYTGAWGGLGVVASWEFWARLEILGWDPLEDAENLNRFAWYSALQEYSRHRRDNAPGSKASTSEDLVSSMISTAIIPRLCKMIAGGAFDSYSANHVRRIVEVTTQVQDSVGAENVKLQMLRKSVLTSFQQTVAETETLVSRYGAQSNARFDPEAIPTRTRFLARRIKLLKNILRWREYTGEKLGIGDLCVRLVERLIVPVAQSGWEVGGAESVQKVTAILPGELVPASIRCP